MAKSKLQKCAEKFIRINKNDPDLEIKWIGSEWFWFVTDQIYLGRLEKGWDGILQSHTKYEDMMDKIDWENIPHDCPINCAQLSVKVLGKDLALVRWTEDVFRMFR